jgi:ATP-dependent helicase/nuclease subunit A
MVQGVIDLVLINDDQCILVDFKTNKVSCDAELIDKYRLQIDLYAKAIAEATNKKVSSRYLYSFNLNKMINL